jgi:hypothetical protein
MNYFNEKRHLNITSNKKRYEQPKGEEPLEHKEKKHSNNSLKEKEVG